MNNLLGMTKLFTSLVSNQASMEEALENPPRRENRQVKKPG